MLQKSLVRAVVKNATAQNPLKKLYVGTKTPLKSLGGEKNETSRKIRSL